MSCKYQESVLAVLTFVEDWLVWPWADQPLFTLYPCLKSIFMFIDFLFTLLTGRNLIERIALKYSFEENKVSPKGLQLICRLLFLQSRTTSQLSIVNDALNRVDRLSDLKQSILLEAREPYSHEHHLQSLHSVANMRVM